MKVLTVAVVLTVALPVMCQGTEVSFDIKASSVENALNQWASQSGLSVMFGYPLGKMRVPSLKRAMEPADALEFLIRDLDAHVVWIRSETVAAIGPGRAYCNPTAGARAPLPPCLPSPLRVRL